jgi:hypothetical protein
VAVPPVRDEKTLFVEETLEDGLDSFDSEVSLGMLDRRAGVERISDLDLFPSEQADADDVVVDAAPESVVAPRAVVVAADRRALAVATEQPVTVPPERPAVVAAIPQRAPVLATRRLAVVAGIFGCLGLTTLGILLLRSPAPLVTPPQLVRDVALLSAARAIPQEPIPTLLATPTPGAPTTLEPTTLPEPPEALMPPEPVADSRGPIASPAPAAVALPLSTTPTARPERLTPGTSADTSETPAVPISAENAGTPTKGAPADLKVQPSVTAKPGSVNDTPPANTPAAPLRPAPAMLLPAAPVSAPAVPAAAGATAATPAPARDAADIQMVLTRYRSAFSDLDAAAVSNVWPNADSRALARAFRGLEEQGIAFDNCDIQVTGTSAAASCSGTVRYVTKVGSNDPRTERRRWQFTLGKVRDLWIIQTVESR